MMFHRRPTAHMKLLPSDLEVSEARFKRFLKDLHTYEQRLSFERTLDAFLDVYSSWKRTHEEPLKLRLVMLAFELHRLDPQFHCDLSFAEQPA
jgi:hypothetical protein